METKLCKKCSLSKPLSEFFRSGNRPNGNERRRPDCKVCASKETSLWRKKNRAHYNSYMAVYRTKNPDRFRAIDMKRLYGLEVADYLKMLADQKECCKICERPPVGKRPLAIDHCHATGVVRGLLCYKCNMDIAVLEKPDFLEKALKYLKR